MIGTWYLLKKIEPKRLNINVEAEIPVVNSGSEASIHVWISKIKEKIAWA